MSTFGRFRTSVSLLAGVAALGFGPLALADPPAAPDQVRPLLIGAVVPSLELTAATGDTVELGAVVSKMPTILVFYRGGW